MPRQRLDLFFKERLLLEPAASGRSNLQRDFRRPLQALGILAALVLLIACANVANLMAARAAARSREMALRVSIGAGRSRLVQLVLMESAWIASLATALAVLFAWRAAPWIAGMIDLPGEPARLSLPMDWRVAGFALVLAMAVTFLFGLAPALRASSVKPASALRGGDDPRSRRSAMHALIALQVAFCFVVELAAGLLALSFDRLTHQPLGFSAERVLNLDAVARRPQPAVFWDQALEHLRSIPGVERAALSGWPIMSGESWVNFVSIDGAPPSDVFSDFFAVSPGWLHTLRIQQISGRDFRDGDVHPGIAIVNEAFTRQYFGGADPVGKTFEMVGSSGVRMRLQIVGFVRDARSRDNLRLAIRPTAYVPFHGADAARGTFVVKTAPENPVGVASMLRREVSRARPELHVANILTQTEIDRAPVVRERVMAMLATFFAGVALLLAGIGLYGVLDYLVTQQRREIGIRIAIGARPSDVAQRVTAGVLSMVLTGAVTGLVSGIASVRYIESLLYQVKATDVRMLAIPAATIFVAAIAAAAPAVVRAMRIDPVEMLRDS